MTSLIQLPIEKLGAVATGLLITALFFLIANGTSNRLFTTYTIFGFAMASSFGYLLTFKSLEVSKIWFTFTALSYDDQVIATIFIVSVVTLFSVLTLSSDTLISAVKETYKPDENFNEMPATVDCNYDFLVPANLPEDDKVFFEQSFDQFAKDFIDDLPTIYELPEESVEWVKRMIYYTASGGKMNRGLSLLAVQKIFAKLNKRILSNKDRIQSAALGWCIEFLQAFFLVADDVMDDSVTRRGQPCWFRLPEVKLIAINDSFILESVVYKLLKRYFGKESYYNQLIDLFIEVTRQTEFGQLLDLTSQPIGGKIDLTRFTIERYRSIVKYKTAFYSFYLPVALGMIVSGIKERKLYEKARTILLIMGEYFQIQDDYLDCYGAPEVIGKIGTDIQDNKCSWLVVKALQMVDNEQRAVIENNYGKHDEDKVNVIKNLYKDLNIEKVFKDYEEDSYRQIIKLLDECKELPREIFEFLLNKIYKRSK